MRGQVSIEYLLVFLIILFLLGFSLSILIDLENKADFLLKLHKENRKAISVINAVEEVCALGDGNSREVPVNGLAIECKGKTIHFQGIKEIVKGSHCEVICNKMNPEILLIENRKGKVYLFQK